MSAFEQIDTNNVYELDADLKPLSTAAEAVKSRSWVGVTRYPLFRSHLACVAFVFGACLFIYATDPGATDLQNERHGTNDGHASRALQKCTHEEGESDPHHVWHLLRRYMQKQALWYTCKSHTYDTQFDRLPPLHLDELMLPPGSSTLFYGHSYLGQLVHNILAAHMVADGISVQLATESPNLEILHSCSFNKYCKQSKSKVFRHWYERVTMGSKRYRFKNNVTIVHIVNDGNLQNGTSTESLRRFLDVYGPFDRAFFMKPHSPCFFKGYETGWKLRSKCIDLVDQRKGCESHYRQFWNAIKSQAKRTIEVEPWQQILNNTVDDENVYCGHEVERLRTAVTLSPGCNVGGPNDCLQTIYGHQCLPGRLTVIAREMLARV